MKCQIKSTYCNNKNLRLCQMKSSRNVYEGAKLYLCEECRKMQNGQFKFAK